MRTLEGISPAETEQCLLSLPFADAVALLRHLHHALRRGVAVELACKSALFLLKVHHKQVRYRACCCDEEGLLMMGIAAAAGAVRSYQRACFDGHCRR